MGKFKYFLIGTGLAFILLNSRLFYNLRRLDRTIDLVGNHDYVVSLEETENFKKIFTEIREGYFPYVVDNAEGKRRAVLYVGGKEQEYIIKKEDADLANLEFRLYEDGRLVDPVGNVGLVHVIRSPMSSKDEDVHFTNTAPKEQYILTETGLEEERPVEKVFRTLGIFFTQVKYEQAGIDNK